jgi:hypothetical protein
MARGGFRPGSGRKPKLKVLHPSHVELLSPAKIPRNERLVAAAASKCGMSAGQLKAYTQHIGFRCEGCGRPFHGTPAVDHDAATGEFRGVLHSNCNTALGMAHDDPDVLRALADYIERKRGMKKTAENSTFKFAGPSL